MAKVLFPLSSFCARGTFNKLVFEKKPHKNIVRLKGLKKRTSNAVQRNQQTKYKRVVQQWKALSIEDKQTYIRRALELHMTGYNLFIKENINLLEVAIFGQSIYNDCVFGIE